MDLPFDPRERDRAVATIRAHLGHRLGAEIALLADDDIEELLFRIACGEW